MHGARRLFDQLIERYNQTQYRSARDALWSWVLRYQLPSLSLPANQSLWTCFFEDKLCNDDDRVSWTSLELARYLLERQSGLDPQWLEHAESLMQFALSLFGGQRPWNVTVMGEQDNDHKPWGGANSKLIAVAALHAVATRQPQGFFANVARRLLAWWTYFVDSDGCPAAHVSHAVLDLVGLTTHDRVVRQEDGVSSHSDRGGWQVHHRPAQLAFEIAAVAKLAPGFQASFLLRRLQEDAHTDVVHNVVDGIRLLAQLDRMR